ncbi:MAG: hypothetical protein ABWY47_20795, partial [Xanthobacteraceae bacterium]
MLDSEAVALPHCSICRKSCVCGDRQRRPHGIPKNRNAAYPLNYCSDTNAINALDRVNKGKTAQMSTDQHIMPPGRGTM